jgi:hypothetical protein
VSRPIESLAAWDAGRLDFLPLREVYEAAYALVDRKLTGERRAEARKFIGWQRSSGRIRALMTRLEALPDPEVSS